MQPVSKAYQAELARTVIGQAHCRVVFYLVDPDAIVQTSFTSQAQSALSDCEAMLAVQPTQKVYASFEGDRFRVGACQVCVPESDSQIRKEGYISGEFAGDDGVFTAQPILEIAFVQPVSLPALTLVFDAICGEYPSQFTLQAYQGNVLVTTHICTPTTAHWVHDTPLVQVTRLVLTFQSMCAPNRRVRVQQIVFGKQIVFDGTSLASVAINAQVDPLARRLPTATAQFSVVNCNPLTGNTNLLYDPENPDGIGKYMEQHSPVQVQFGQNLSGTDVIEWVQGGRFYLTATPKSQGMYATFDAQDTLSLLTGIYRKGVYTGEGVSLYTLAQQVLADANLPILRVGELPWVLDDALRAITTTAPLPLRTHRECLQLIAHAGNCTLHCLRDGTVVIAQNTDASPVCHLGASDILDEPTTAKSATLAGVQCDVHTITPKAECTKLHESVVSVGGTTALYITHTSATDIVVTATGGSLQASESYARVTKVTLVGAGDVTVTIMGKPLETSTTAVKVIVQDADPNSATEVVQNELITTIACARAVAQHTCEYLLGRTSYTVVTRGNVELEPLDMLTLQTLYDPASNVQLLGTKIAYDGNLKTTLTLKRKEITCANS